MANPILEQFDRVAKRSANSEPNWLLPIRKAGLSKFSESGFPTQRGEDWRFTNTAQVAKLPFQLSEKSTSENLTSDILNDTTFGSLGGIRLVFVNGFYSERLSDPHHNSNGIHVGTLSRGFETAADLIKQHIGKCASNDDNSFEHLNAAFFQDGAFVHVSANVHLEEPIHLVFVSTEEASGATIHLRNLVIAESGARFTLTENYFSIKGVSYVTNTVTNFVVRDSAFVEHIKFQDESLDAFHLATLHSDLGAASRYISHSFALGARLSRNTIRSKLNGPGLECVFNGLYITRKDQVADHHMVIEHTQPNCASHEYFNGILDDQSKGIFHGRILVQPEAQKTDAKQTNKNILLSDSATVNTKPQLEIYADDVKCTHGATIGQLNEESIFYLRSRGIGQETARRMLIHSFAGEIIERVDYKPAREELDQLIWSRLEQNPRLSENKQLP